MNDNRITLDEAKEIIERFGKDQGFDLKPCIAAGWLKADDETGELYADRHGLLFALKTAAAPEDFAQAMSGFLKNDLWLFLHAFRNGQLELLPAEAASGSADATA